MSLKYKPQLTKPNYMYSVLSVSLVLFVLGLFGLAILYSNGLVKLFKERVNVMVELKNDAKQQDIDKFRDFLNESNHIKESTIKYISKEKAAEFLKDDFGEDFAKLNMPNPFYDVFSFNIKAEYLSPEALLDFKKQILTNKCVSDVFYQENLVEEISKNLKKISFIILGIGIFFLFVAITLIHNTIRLALYSNRFLIKNMQLVGASPGFIGKPYLTRGLLHGIFSGLFSAIILGLMLFILWKNLPELNKLVDIKELSLVFLSIVVLGIMLYLISTHIVLRKFLKLRTEELY